MCTLKCTLCYNCRFFGFEKKISNADKIDGARGRTRTDTRLPLPDFESGASTGFTTRAKKNCDFIYKDIKKRLK